jgi:hypothetical protein
VPRGDYHGRLTCFTCLQTAVSRELNVSVRKTASAVKDCLETGMRLSRSGMYALYRPEVLRGPSDGIVPILVRLCVSLSSAFLLQLQIIYLY